MAPFSEVFQIETDEYIVELFRSSAMMFFKKSFLWFCLLFLLFFFLFPLFRMGNSGSSIFFIGLCIVVFAILRILVSWLGTCYIITNKRIIAVERAGYLKKDVYEISLSSVSELSYTSKGVFQMLFSFGTVILALTTPRGSFHLKNISSPALILERVSKLLSELKKQ